MICDVCGKEKLEVKSIDRAKGFFTIKSEQSIEVCKECYEDTIKDGFMSVQILNK